MSDLDLEDELAQELRHDLDAYDEGAGERISASLFEGDEGGLELAQRQALVTLLKQRFISARSHPRDWQVLVEHERLLRSRLNDLFLDLAIDRDREVAWKRQAVSETGSRFPTLVYDAAWSREETLVLVHLRDRLRAGNGAGDSRVFIDRDDILDHVATFRPSHATDEAGDEKRARAAVQSVAKAGLLIPAGSEDRFEISEAIEPLLPLELLQDLLAALRDANAAPADTATTDPADDELFDEGADEAGDEAGDEEESG
ncbi:MAG: DUF4194 domain-containing protein [Nocardioidaceae bacterium]|nr:DUF4194 domain-containing protein [Nocardioidaceae bacterium]